MGQAGDLDKTVSDFLLELDSLYGSLQSTQDRKTSELPQTQPCERVRNIDVLLMHREDKTRTVVPPCAELEREDSVDPSGSGSRRLRSLLSRITKK